MKPMNSNLFARLIAKAGTLCLLLVASTSYAQLTIDVTTSSGRQIPLAIVAFVGEASAPQNITPLVAADLTRTGLFKMVPTNVVFPLADSAPINYPEWNQKGAEGLVVGNIAPQPDGRFEVRFRLFDVAKQVQTASFSYMATATQLRATAHRIADEIYEKMIGERGVFSTKIAYVLKTGSLFQLQVADADGFNPQTVLKSQEPIRSPKWSPDGSKLAYVSFESRKSNIIVQDLGTSQRRVVANFRGDNYAPGWSPTGSV
jgi:TolB protein